MATHSSVLAWMIPWTQELSGLQSIGLQRVGHDWSDLTHTARQSILGTIRLARHNNFFMWEGTFMWSEVKVKVTQSCPWNSPGQNAGVGSLSLLQGSSQTRDWTQVFTSCNQFFSTQLSTLQADSLPSEPQWKQWNITQPLKSIKLYHMQRHGWT